MHSRLDSYLLRSLSGRKLAQLARLLPFIQNVDIRQISARVTNETSIEAPLNRTIVSALVVYTRYQCKSLHNLQNIAEADAQTHSNRRLKNGYRRH
jgi:hypothetical protein